MAVPALNGQNSSKKSSHFNMKGESVELGLPGSMRNDVLMKVITENYDAAIENLRELLEAPSEYPDFKFKTSRYISHSIELIEAIKAKKGFAGMDSLTSSKQQELIEQFKGQFKSLQHTLKVIEKIQNDLRVQDVRTTIYVVNAFWYSLVAVVGFAFFLEFVYGLMDTAISAGDGILGDIAQFIAQKLGF